MTSLKHTIIHSLRLNWLAMRLRKHLGREIIPDPKSHLYIETSSICNLRCRFCAYRKKDGLKMTMDHAFFCDVVDQATELGYAKFGLSPLTGEVFASQDFITKLEYLENHPKVVGYSFFTNFTLADEQTISRLVTLQKLENLNISIYGHDRDSFVAITGSNDRLYDNLIENLDLLIEKMGSHSFALRFWWRTYSHLENVILFESELASALRRLSKTFERQTQINVCSEYSNWGGYITPDDVKDIDITFVDEKSIFRYGACAMVFYKNIVLADGRVNACACGDVNASLVIGDLRTESLRKIYSSQNKRYMGLITAQQRGHFPSVCRTCYIYSSIYRIMAYPDVVRRTLTLQEFLRELDT